MAFATHMPWASFLSSETFVKPWASIRALACISVIAAPAFGVVGAPADGVAGCVWAAVGPAGCFASYWANAAPAVRLAIAAMRITERMVHLQLGSDPHVATPMPVNSCWKLFLSQSGHSCRRAATALLWRCSAEQH